MKDNGIKKVFHSFRTEKDRYIIKLRRRWQRLSYRQQRIIILYLLGLFAAIDLAYIVGGFCGTASPKDCASPNGQYPTIKKQCIQ